MWIWAGEWGWWINHLHSNENSTHEHAQHKRLRVPHFHLFILLSVPPGGFLGLMDNLYPRANDLAGLKWLARVIFRHLGILREEKLGAASGSVGRKVFGDSFGVREMNGRRSC